jgi:hypothetical protein
VDDGQVCGLQYSSFLSVLFSAFPFHIFDRITTTLMTTRGRDDLPGEMVVGEHKERKCEKEVETLLI